MPPPPPPGAFGPFLLGGGVAYKSEETAPPWGGGGHGVPFKEKHRWHTWPAKHSKMPRVQGYGGLWFRNLPRPTWFHPYFTVNDKSMVMGLRQVIPGHVGEHGRSGPDSCVAEWPARGISSSPVMVCMPALVIPHPLSTTLTNSQRCTAHLKGRVWGLFRPKTTRLGRRGLACNASSPAGLSSPEMRGLWKEPQGRDALEGEGPHRRPQQPLGRRLEEVAEAVGGGYCRLQMPLKPALGVRGTVAGHRLGALEGG